MVGEVLLGRERVRLAFQPPRPEGPSIHWRREIVHPLRSTTGVSRRNGHGPRTRVSFSASWMANAKKPLRSSRNAGPFNVYSRNTTSVSLWLSELVPLCFKIRSKRLEVEDLAVEHDGEATSFVGEGLVPCIGHVKDAEPPMAQNGASVPCRCLHHPARYARCGCNAALIRSPVAVAGREVSIWKEPAMPHIGVSVSGALA
jgi:hypothetical protein